MGLTVQWGACVLCCRADDAAKGVEERLAARTRAVVDAVTEVLTSFAGHVHAAASKADQLPDFPKCVGCVEGVLCSRSVGGTMVRVYT
jgi:hypothetical protein